MGPVYLLALRQLSGRWRLLIMGALALLPILVTVPTLRSGHAPSAEEFEAVVLNAMLAGSIIPLVVLAIAAAAFGIEVEDRTLANLTLSPLPRWRIVVPKLLAAMTIAAPFIVFSAGVTSHLTFLGDPRATAAVTIAALAGVAMYASAFVWLGLVTHHAVALGLLYIVVWEGIFSRFVAGVRLLSIRHYAVSLMHAMDERRFVASDPLAPAVAVAMAACLFTLFVALSIRRLRRMDVP